MDLAVAVRAANLRAVARAAVPDALVIASGLLSGCDAIITNDGQWKRRTAALFPGFRWLNLGDDGS